MQGSPEKELELDFGFLFCRVSHFYSMSYREVMALPINAFWLMCGCINRVQAEFDVRQLAVLESSQSGEGFSEHRKNLVLEISGGKAPKEMPAQYDETRDQDGFNELKAMAALM